MKTKSLILALFMAAIGCVADVDRDNPADPKSTECEGNFEVRDSTMIPVSSCPWDPVMKYYNCSTGYYNPLYIKNTSSVAISLDPYVINTSCGQTINMPEYLEPGQQVSFTVKTNACTTTVVIPKCEGDDPFVFQMWY